MSHGRSSRRWCLRLSYRCPTCGRAYDAIVRLRRMKPCWVRGAHLRGPEVVGVVIVAGAGELVERCVCGTAVGQGMACCLEHEPPGVGRVVECGAILRVYKEVK